MRLTNKIGALMYAAASLLALVLMLGAAQAHFKKRLKTGLSQPHHIVDTQVGTVSFRVSGSVGGKTEDALMQLIAIGMERGCSRETSTRLKAPSGSLVVVWHVAPGGPNPVAIITAELLSGDHVVAYTFDQTISPDTAPAVVFESEIAEMTCALMRKAGYLKGTRQ